MTYIKYDLLSRFVAHLSIVGSIRNLRNIKQQHQQQPSKILSAPCGWELGLLSVARSDIIDKIKYLVEAKIFSCPCEKIKKTHLYKTIEFMKVYIGQKKLYLPVSILKGVNYYDYICIKEFDVALNFRYIY